MWEKFVFYILDIAVLYVLSKWIYDIVYSIFSPQSGKRCTMKNWYGTYQKIYKVRCHEAIVKLFAGTSGILSSVSESFNDTRTAILLIAFILIIISAFSDILESLRNIPKKQRIGYVSMSAVYLLIGIFFYKNSCQDTLTNINSVIICIIYFYSSVVLVPILQYVSQWHISVYRWCVEVFLWLNIITFLYFSYIFASVQTPDNTVLTLIIIKLFLSIILVVFNVYMESKLRSSNHSRTSFFTALLQDDDDAAFTSLKVNKRVLTSTKESGKQSFSKEISQNVKNVQLLEGKEISQTATVINLEDSSMTCDHKKTSSENIYEEIFFIHNVK